MLKPIPLARYAFLFCQALLLLSCSNKASSVAGGAGFKEAIFDEAMLNTVMNDPQCVTVRFYNVRRTASDNKGTALAIGVRSDGTEIYNGTSAKYRMSDKISGGSVIYIDLLKPAAIAACDLIKTAGDVSYSCEFTKTAVAALLAGTACNGVRLVPERLDPTTWTMRMKPVKIASGSFTNLSAPPSVMCTEPCPNFCGPASHYLNM